MEELPVLAADKLGEGTKDALAPREGAKDTLAAGGGAKGALAIGEGAKDAAVHVSCLQQGGGTHTGRPAVTLLMSGIWGLACFRAGVVTLHVSATVWIYSFGSSSCILL